MLSYVKPFFDASTFTVALRIDASDATTTAAVWVQGLYNSDSDDRAHHRRLGLQDREVVASIPAPPTVEATLSGPQVFSLRVSECGVHAAAVSMYFHQAKVQLIAQFFNWH